MKAEARGAFLPFITRHSAFVISPSFFVGALLPLFGQFAQGDGEVARGALDAVGDGFQFAHAVGRAYGDGGERALDECRQAFGGRLRFPLGA
ncbi:MAG TPA: hypothetical protein VER32_12315 [Pyrinomonadaceae bacterium]|nr:hypothetical protein [Pyrinomonadaceae bacterium]